MILGTISVFFEDSTSCRMQPAFKNFWAKNKALDREKYQKKLFLNVFPQFLRVSVLVIKKKLCWYLSRSKNISWMHLATGTGILKKLKKLKKYQVLNTESYGTNKRLKNIAKILIFKIFLILELCWKTQWFIKLRNTWKILSLTL
jgi:hypothetical protein